MAASSLSETTLFVGNLPERIKSNNLEEVFSDVGPVKRCFIVTDKDSHKSKGVAYVTFALREHAENAVKTIKHIEGNKLNIKFARKRNYAANNPEADKDASSENTDQKKIKKEPRQKKKRQQNKAKLSRLIIRNLSFQATENDIRKAFQEFGTIKEVVIPLRKDGKKVGCCFVQFDNIESANLAIQNMNAKEILGRVVAVDWSVPKNTYLQVQNSIQSMRTEKPIADIPENDSQSKDILSNVDFSGIAKQISKKQKANKQKIKLKQRNEDEGDTDEIEDLSEDDDEEDNEDESTDEEDKNNDHNKYEHENDDDEDDDDDDDDEAEEEDDDDDDDDDEDDDFKNRSKKQRLSNDVNEGKTLFLRNLTFSTTKDDLMLKFGTFGKLVYAIVCIDQDTEHSKGTAFIKFEEKESAEKCLEVANDEKEDGGIIINGNKVNVSIALSPDELKKKLEEKKTKKDTNKRNLHLAREGFIRPGTLAAEGVSTSDMAKRQKLESWKKNMLQNLHMFISPMRLCVRNIPLTMIDSRLKQIFQNTISSDGKITECRIIRDLRKRDDKGFPLSKGFGFISFTRHEDALKALREINNNPTIFTKDQRPIVEFSIENRAALKAKERRLERSKHNMSNKKNIFPKPVEADSLNEIGPKAHFVGSKANPKMKLSLPSHSGPKIRHKPRPTSGKQKISRKQFIKNRHKRPKQFKRPESAGKKNKKKSSRSKKPLDFTEKQLKKKMHSKTDKKQKKWFE